MRGGTDYQPCNLKLAEMQPDEMIVKIVASGICMSDETIRNGKTSVDFPVALGHEGTGIFEKVGDQVVLSYAYFENCPRCQAGHPSISND